MRPNKGSISAAGFAERQTLLTRAAVIEAQRQAARDRGDLHALRDHEAELRRLWMRYVALDCQNDSQRPLEARR